MMTYITVCEQKPESLDAIVSARLRMGWKLHGNPYMAMVIPKGSKYDPVPHMCQAMTLIHKKTDKVK